MNVPCRCSTSTMTTISPPDRGRSTGRVGPADVRTEHSVATSGGHCGRRRDRVPQCPTRACARRTLPAAHNPDRPGCRSGDWAGDHRLDRRQRRADRSGVKRLRSGPASSTSSPRRGFAGRTMPARISRIWSAVNRTPLRVCSRTCGTRPAVTRSRSVVGAIPRSVAASATPYSGCRSSSSTVVGTRSFVTVGTVRQSRWRAIAFLGPRRHRPAGQHSAPEDRNGAAGSADSTGRCRAEDSRVHTRTASRSGSSHLPATLSTTLPHP